MDFTLELDACLTGLGGRWSRFVYHLPIIRGFMNFSIVHLEMVNILLAVRLFQVHWSGRKVLVKCDNEAVVSVLRSGRTRDPYLGACARNIWYVSALADIDLQYVHIRGVDNGWLTCCLAGLVVLVISVNCCPTYKTQYGSQ